MKEAILSEVTVTGLTGTERMKDSPIAFSVVTPKWLQQSFGANMVDAISLHPGLAQISTGVGISKPIIRGLGHNRVVVVEQGIRQESQQWGDEHGLEVDASGVHSVEILKGPASLMYGSDAIAGVVVLHPEHPLMEGTLQAKLGDEYQSNNGLYNYHAGFAGNVNGLLWNWHFNDKAAHCYKNKQDGYVPGTWFKERDVMGMLGVQKPWGHSYWRFSHVNFTPGIPEGERSESESRPGALVWADGSDACSYANQLPFQRVLHTKVVSDNAWRVGHGMLKTIVGYQQNFRREFEEEMTEAELSMRLHTVNYDLRWQLPLAHSWNLATGVNGMWQQNRNEAEETLIPDYRLFDFGYFLTANKQVERWHLSGGARIDNRQLWNLPKDTQTDKRQPGTTSPEKNGDAQQCPSLRRNFTGITGSLGAVYNINPHTNLRLNAARGFRAPTVGELSSDGVHEGSIRYELGNANLRSEYSTQIDLGMDYTTHYVSLSASLFTNWIQNYIFLDRLPYETEGYQTFQYRQGDARLMGGEMSVDVHPINPLHVENTFSYVRGVQLHKPDGGRNLPMMPAPRWTSLIRYEFPDFARKHCRRSYVSFGLVCHLRQNHVYTSDPLADSDEVNETPTPAYTTFNLSAGVDLHVLGHSCIELTLSCQNLFDKVYQPHLSRLKYADAPGVSAMGRNICFKVNVPLDIHLKR
ncbi:MAG: TonB-dependent receptor [Bacteroidales bacterium]|nr:TonB-dependent receptor [Candidatus Physcousia equi]